MLNDKVRRWNMVESMPNLRENSENVTLGGVLVDREMEGLFLMSRK